MPPHNVPFVLIGAIMWVGCLALMPAVNWPPTLAGMAQQSPRWRQHRRICLDDDGMDPWGKPTAVGIATGAVAGLVAITPAPARLAQWARSRLVLLRHWFATGQLLP